MNDIKNCVVAVLVAGKLQGTGYVVTDRLVITCAHVLTNDDSPPKGGISIRFHCNGEEVPVDVATDWWSPPDKDDIAVLGFRLEPEQSLPAAVQAVKLGRNTGRKNRECEIFGYPDVGQLNGLGGRATVIEEVCEFDGRKLIQLRSGQATCGYSGSPLLDPETGEVIGTVVEIADQARARYAAHLHARLDDLAFATPLEVIAGLVPGLPLDSEQDVDEHEKARNRVREGISQILRIHKDASTYLATKFDGLDKCNEDEKRERVTDHLLNASLGNFLPLVINGFTAHARNQREIATAFRDLATFIIPQIYQRDFLRAIRRRWNAGSNFLVVPASHKSIIELYVAGALGHPLSFNEDWQFDSDIPAGKLEIAASAESGILHGHALDQFLNSFEQAIMTKIGGLAAKMPNPTRAINRKLAKLKDGEPPIRYYYVYPNGQSQVEELESRYRDVVFISHQLTEHDDDQFDILDTLKDMFCPPTESDQ